MDRVAETGRLNQTRPCLKVVDRAACHRGNRVGQDAVSCQVHMGSYRPSILLWSLAAFCVTVIDPIMP